VQADAREPPRPAPEDAIQEVKEAKFTLTVEEQVVTVVLYVPRAQEDTLVIADNVISIQARGGQPYQATINPPFPLRSKPIVKINPVMLYLIFVEREDEEPDTAPPEPEPEFDLAEEIPPLRNPYIFDLEP
jgi:hypothetical protein